MATPQTYQTTSSMPFHEAIRQCLKKYGDFSGRATRPEYWWWVLAHIIAGSILAIIDAFIVSLINREDAFSPLYVIFVLAALLPCLAVTSRRLHDIGKSGWWLLAWIVVTSLGWIPLAIGIAVFTLDVLDGWVGTNVEFVPLMLGGVISLAVEAAALFWMVLWLSRQGDTGPNGYGPNPRPAPVPAPVASAPAAELGLPETPAVSGPLAPEPGPASSQPAAPEPSREAAVGPESPALGAVGFEEAVSPESDGGPSVSPSGEPEPPAPLAAGPPATMPEAAVPPAAREEPPEGRG